MSDDKLTNVSRREFARNLARFLVFGGLAHFSLSGFGAIMPSGTSSKSKDCPGGRFPEDECIVVDDKYGKGDDDYCPGGGPTVDICNPEFGYEDNCPGETMPEDECSPSGVKRYANGLKDDDCDVGSAVADVCATGVNDSDQCPSGKAEDDICELSVQTDDRCYSGLHSDDVCPPDGGVRDGDDCPGGGGEVDTCANDGKGDECSNGSWSFLGDEDDCNASEPDVCGSGLTGLADDDTCITGRNVPHGTRGPDDWCRGDRFASDVCWSGKEEDDLCISRDSRDGAHDECPGGSAILDTCNSNSDDYCQKSEPSSDECKPHVDDEDECPGGAALSDECNSGLPEEDECPEGLPQVDICLTIVVGSDECRPTLSGSDGPTDGCLLSIPDSIE